MIRTFAIASLGVSAAIALPPNDAMNKTSAFPTDTSQHAIADREVAEYLFETWKREYGMEFDTAEEEIKRLNVFAANNDRIMEHNKSGAPYTMAHNKFSHLTSDEFAAQNIRGYSPPADGAMMMDDTKLEFDLDVSKAPKAIDWTDKGAVTAVKNQGQCGSCWSFSTTGALEGRYFLKTGKLHTLSEQELVDCDQNDSGCNGGLMDYGFAYAKKKGLSSESAYAYDAKEGSCHSSSIDRDLPAGVVKGSVDIPHGDENALKAAVAKGPVSVAIEADQQAFQFYSGGVMTGYCGRQLDHGVLAVGYGTSGGDQYWKVKNSWGAEWGEEGYIRIQRGTQKCGIADGASYPSLQ